MGPTPIINFTNIIILLLFSALSISNAAVLDTDGFPLINGGNYLIRPKDITVNGGLTITSGSGCPYYITQDKDETFPGIPVTISSPAKIPVILPGLPISIIFDHYIDTCMQSLKWQVISDESTGKSYVRTGGSGWSPNFSISSESGGSYKIKYNSKENGGEIGFFEKDGLLGVNTDTPLNVVFVKAGFHVIAMKV